ncbi:MAG: class I SAM-dependent methyltransferase [Actinomycetota bacterium]|nr:class I SAM-dependent methyltransferase [Actinomycetota bacterium]
MNDRSDAYGAMLLAALEGGEAVEIVERDDGFIMASVLGPGLYLAPYRRWPAHHRRAIRSVRGRVLDVGCGGGRVALHLEERGHEVVSIDTSPGAIEVCRRRGVLDARLLSIDDVDDSLGRFDTIVMLGNNLGLLANERKGKRLLRRFHRVTSERGRIVAESRDVHRTDDPAHLAYHERNRRRGRLDGQIRVRVRFRDRATPWFDYLMVSPAELAGLLDSTGWVIGRILESEDTYVAVIVKEGRARASRSAEGDSSSAATSAPSGRRPRRRGPASSRS